jgi:GNAT superfamily N-acetyltransferase
MSATMRQTAAPRRTTGTVPRLTDPKRIRKTLDRDREWAAYAIGDLSPGFIEHCEWHAPAHHDNALVLLYRGFNPPIVFAIGAPADLRELFGELAAPEISLHIRPETLDAMRGIYVPQAIRRIQRMVLRPDAFKPVPDSDVRPLGERDLEAVTALYRDGHERGDAPAFFHPSMLRQGTFRGVWEDGELVCTAGTHVYSRELGVCAIGNVFTRGDRRGRGLGARVTSAVVSQAVRDALPTIVLNVGCDNPAQRVYERLGFERYCVFLEGEATRMA